MADLTGDALDPDVVTCVCGLQWDRNIYAQCGNCSTNLWELDRAVPRTDRTASTPDATVMEGAGDHPTSMSVLMCGRRLTVADGQTLPLGRHEEFPSAEALREAANVSRRHAILRFEDGRIHVIDTDSTNGTFVDDQRLPARHEYEIRPGQALRLASDVAIDIVWETK